ncbi:hypothetical protein A9Q78_02690 [Methylophaga sp. 41_12_T18]|nr:hypothetical protein A9Q78_02690 [Methylophaga sp. 41_12_T18]
MLLLYFVHFNLFSIPFLSHEQSDWSSFGSFIGGTTGPLVAFLAYSGVRQQLKEQRESYQKQLESLAFQQHMERIKDSFERVNVLSINSVKPLETHVQINLDTCLSSQLKEAASNAEPFVILQDVIHASRLIQSAAFVYQQYIHLINESTKHLSQETPLNEHRWCAIATWREFEKRAKFINHLAMKTESELLKGNPELYKDERKEILMCIGSYESWERDWKRMGIGF